MYDPTTGRWLSQDPIGFSADDLNLYRYVKNDPVTATDPTGTRQAQALEGSQDEFVVNKDTGPYLSYYVTSGWFGNKSAPAWRYAFWDESVFDGAGYRVTLKILGKTGGDNICNTPFQLSSDVNDNHAGTLLVHLKNLPTSGTYRVTARVYVTRSSRPGVSLPLVNVFTADGNDRGDKLIWSPAASSRNYASDSKTLTFTLLYRKEADAKGYRNASDAIIIRPVFSFTGTEEEYQRVYYAIYTSKIERIGSLP